MEISSKEIALAIGKTPSAVSYLKKRNEKEFMLLKVGLLCSKLQLDYDDLITIHSLKNIQLQKIAS